MKTSQKSRGEIMNAEHKIHSAALMLPKMSDAEFADLKADIQANGLLQPILRKQGYVIDGAHRLRACEELGIEPTYEEFSGDDIISEITSLNLFRRHLSADQRATLVVKMRRDQSAKAKRRDQNAQGRTREIVAAEAKVSERKARQAIDAVATAPPEIVDEIIAGKRPLRRRRKRKPFQVPVGSEPWRQDVVRRFTRFLDRWPVTQHQDVKKIIGAWIKEK